MGKTSKIYNLLWYVAIIGDVVYVLWILYNGIDEGFKDIGSVESIALIGLIFLLILNIALLYRPRKQ
jgi:hypothetical protein